MSGWSSACGVGQCGGMGVHPLGLGMGLWSVVPSSLSSLCFCFSSLVGRSILLSLKGGFVAPSFNFYP